MKKYFNFKVSIIVFVLISVLFINVNAISSEDVVKTASTKPYYVNLNNNELVIIQKYSAINDIKFTWKKMYPNDIFNLYSIHFIPNTSDEVSNNFSGGNLLLNIGTDTLGPYLIKALNNIDGNKIYTNQFTGGSHGYNNNYVVAETNTPTGKSKDLIFKINGKIKTSFSGYCDNVDVYWESRIQATNTIKSDGTGREVVEENYHLNFKDNQINVFNNIKFLEPVNVLSYYGLQSIIPSLFKGELFYHTSENHFWVSASVNSNSIDDNCNIITSRKNGNYLEMELDVNTGLGKNKLLDTTQYNALTASYGKTYFYLIENQKFDTNESLSYRGTYRFYAK